MPEVLFVGREREQDLYNKFLLRETPWVLIITGLGGIGKTTLLHRLAEYTLTLPNTTVVMLDFANEDLRNDPLKILDKLTKDITPYCDLQQIDSNFQNELQKNIDQLAKLSAEKAQTGASESDDLALREIRHQMRELATEAFYAQIKTYKLDQLVIILDTCEWLNEPEGIEVGQWVMNELIPGIHSRMRQKNRRCSVVMASRIRLKLDVINGRDQRCLTLSMLGKAEVDQYLMHMGMQDSHLRQRVYEVTHGHALCVSIIGDFWRDREEQTQPFTVADLPELQEFSEIALVQFTNERVLKQLRSPFKELTRYGVLLRSFDLPLLRNVFPEFLPEPEALERFNQLIRYPYIESRGNYRYAFHELLREALTEETQKEEPEKWQNYHKRALDYLTQISPHSPDWYYHLLAYDEKQGRVEWHQAIGEARGKRENIGALLQAALDKALKLSPMARAVIEYEHGRFNFYSVQWEEALKSYEEALTCFQEVGDLSGQAEVLQARGDVQRALARQDDALKSYEQALALFQQVGDKFGEAKCSQAMGDVQRLRNDLRAAKHYYDQGVVLFRQLKDKSEEAKVLEAVGDVQRLRNDLDAALPSYEEALALYQEEKDSLKRAKVLMAIGDVQRLLKNKNAALESYRQALALFGELKEPTEEANVRRAIDEMQQPQSEQTTLSESKAFPRIADVLERALNKDPTKRFSSVKDFKSALDDAARTDRAGQVTATAGGPQMFGTYKAIRPLGKGGFAQVYLVEDSLGQQRVLKQIHKDLIKQDPDFRQRFARAARIQQGLKHPHIAQVYDFNAEEGYLVIDGGQTMQKLLNDWYPEGMPPSTALKMLEPIGQALTYVHEQLELAHLDVTPENILIQEMHTSEGGTEWNPLLADFGIARWMSPSGSPERQSWFGVGTRGYRAPEQYTVGRGEPTVKSDVYSLGVMTHEMLSGHRPPIEPGKALRPLRELNSTISSKVEAVVQQATKDDPSERYQSVTGFLKALRDAIEESSTDPSRSTTQHPPHPKPPPRMRRRPVLLLCVLVLILGGGGGWYATVRPFTTPARKWAFPTGGVIDSSPAVVNGVVYVGSDDGTLYAIDAASRKQKWAYQTGDRIDSSPAVVNGVVYVGSFDDTLYAIDAASGTKKWAYQTGSHISSSPAVVDGVVYVGSEDRTLYAIDAVSGTEKWAYQTGGIISSSPRVVYKTVYVGSEDDTLYAIDAASGTKKWAYQTGDRISSSPAVVDGVVYVGSDDGTLYAIDAASGTKKWAYQTGSHISSSPTIVNGVVYVGSEDHTLYAFGLSQT